MRQQWVLIAVVLFGPAAVCRADSGANDAGANNSPRQALVAQDAAARAGNLDADLSFYQSEDARQRQLARAIAEGDLAVAKLQQAVEKRFGKDLADAVVRATGAESPQAVENAGEHVEGDHATVTFKDTSQRLPMVRVGGKWKISLAEWIRGTEPRELAALTNSLQKFDAGLRQLADLVEHEKFRSGEGVRDRVQELHDRLFGASH